MKSTYRSSIKNIWLSGLLGMPLLGCSAADSEITAEGEVASTSEAIIAGVDAKSPTLNAVGALVQVYRYTYYPWGSCGSTGVGGATGAGGAIGVGGAVGTSTAASINSHTGRLDRTALNWTGPIVGATYSALVSGAGGSTSTSTSKGGAPAGGASTGTSTGSTAGTSAGGSTSGGSTCQPIEIVQYWPFCTGTLIGERTVMTAEHCVRNLEYYDGMEVGFAVGSDAFNPTRVYPIVDYSWESEVPADYGSVFGELGSDVGVVQLGEAAAGITPMALGTLTDSDIGKRYTALGYGVQNNYQVNGTRKAGSVTYQGTGGNYADYAFGGLEGFLKVAPSMPAFAGLPQEYLAEIYSQLTLIPDYMGFFGGKRGDAQPCYGDSGGPIIATNRGVRTVYGNVTNGFGSSRLVCDFGVVAAIFGPLTLSYLEESRNWVDPCAGVSQQGYCDGDVAIRCTNRSEGARRLSETDCSLLGQTCGLDATSAVVCVDPIE